MYETAKKNRCTKILFLPRKNVGKCLLGLERFFTALVCLLRTFSFSFLYLPFYFVFFLRKCAESMGGCLDGHTHKGLTPFPPFFPFLPQGGFKSFYLRGEEKREEGGITKFYPFLPSIPAPISHKRQQKKTAKEGKVFISPCEMDRVFWIGLENMKK